MEGESSPPVTKSLILKDVCSASGTGCSRIVASVVNHKKSASSFQLKNFSSWSTKLNEDNMTSFCVLELNRKVFLKKLGVKTVEIIIKPVPGSVPQRCVVETSNSPNVGFKTVEKNWIFINNSGDYTQNLKVDDQKIGRYIKLCFYDKLDDTLFTHKIDSIQVFLEVVEMQHPDRIDEDELEDSESHIREESDISIDERETSGAKITASFEPRDFATEVAVLTPVEDEPLIESPKIAEIDVIDRSAEITQAPTTQQDLELPERQIPDLASHEEQFTKILQAIVAEKEEQQREAFRESSPELMIEEENTPTEALSLKSLVTQVIEQSESSATEPEHLVEQPVLETEMESITEEKNTIISEELISNSTQESKYAVEEKAALDEIGGMELSDDDFAKPEPVKKQKIRRKSAGSAFRSVLFNQMLLAEKERRNKELEKQRLEEEQKRLAEEAKRLEELQRKEEELRRKEEEERLKLEAEAQEMKLRQEEERRKLEAEAQEMKRQQEEERSKLEAEALELKRKQEEALREIEEKKQQLEEQKRLEEERLAQLKLLELEEIKKKQDLLLQEELRKKEELEQIKIRQEQEEQRRIAELEILKRKQEEEEEFRRKEYEALKLKQEEELRQLILQKEKEEKQRLADLEAMRRKQEIEEQKRRQELEELKKQQDLEAKLRKIQMDKDIERQKRLAREKELELKRKEEELKRKEEELIQKHIEMKVELTKEKVKEKAKQLKKIHVQKQKLKKQLKKQKLMEERQKLQQALNIRESPEKEMQNMNTSRNAREVDDAADMSQLENTVSDLLESNKSTRARVLEKYNEYDIDLVSLKEPRTDISDANYLSDDDHDEISITSNNSLANSPKEMEKIAEEEIVPVVIPKIDLSIPKQQQLELLNAADILENISRESNIQDDRDKKEVTMEHIIKTRQSIEKPSTYKNITVLKDDKIQSVKDSISKKQKSFLQPTKSSMLKMKNSSNYPAPKMQKTSLSPNKPVTFDFVKYDDLPNRELPVIAPVNTPLEFPQSIEVTTPKGKQTISEHRYSPKDIIIRAPTQAQSLPVIISIPKKQIQTQEEEEEKSIQEEVQLIDSTELAIEITPPDEAVEEITVAIEEQKVASRTLTPRNQDIQDNTIELLDPPKLKNTPNDGNTISNTASHMPQTEDETSYIFEEEEEDVDVTTTNMFSVVDYEDSDDESALEALNLSENEYNKLLLEKLKEKLKEQQELKKELSQLKEKLLDETMHHTKFLESKQKQSSIDEFESTENLTEMEDEQEEYAKLMEEAETIEQIESLLQRKMNRLGHHEENHKEKVEEKLPDSAYGILDEQEDEDHISLEEAVQFVSPVEELPDELHNSNLEFESGSAILHHDIKGSVEVNNTATHQEDNVSLNEEPQSVIETLSPESINAANPPFTEKLTSIEAPPVEQIADADIILNQEQIETTVEKPETPVLTPKQIPIANKDLTNIVELDALSSAKSTPRETIVAQIQQSSSTDSATEEQKDKVALIAEVLSRKEQLVKLMQKGTTFLKYQFNGKSSKGHTRLLKLDSTRSSITIEKSGSSLIKSKPKRILLSDIKWIVCGNYCRNKRMVSQKRKPSNQYSWRCFSIICNKRTTDLEAVNDLDAEIWIAGLQSLVYETILSNDRPLYSVKSLFWRRIKLKMLASAKLAKLRSIKKKAASAATATFTNLTTRSHIGDSTVDEETSEASH